MEQYVLVVFSVLFLEDADLRVQRLGQYPDVPSCERGWRAWRERIDEYALKNHLAPSDVMYMCQTPAQADLSAPLEALDKVPYEGEVHTRESKS